MTKKVIIYVLIFLIVINTIYWISLIKLLDILEFDNEELKAAVGRLLYRHSSVLRELNFSLLNGLFRFSGEHGYYAVKNIIDLLAITDAVLIAISFMIILLYKKE